jgi:chaperonin GroES
MGFKPLHDRVVVSRFDEEVKTAGGIILPDTAQEKPSEGTVVSVGKGIRGEDGVITPLDVKKGDHVLFGKFGGTEIKVDGEDFMILRESDILGIIETPKKSKSKAKKAA